MNKIENTSKKFKYFLLDHPVLKFFCENGKDVIITVISAFLYTYGFRAFTAPLSTPVSEHLISGGASGLAQALVRFINLFMAVENPALSMTLQSVFYFMVNAPLLIFAYFKIGKKFTFYTLLNVGLVSLFTNFLPDDIFTIVDFSEQVLARPLFAGIVTAISIILAFSAGGSTGGADIIAFYVSNKKSSSFGKFSMIINVIVVGLYVSLTIIDFSLHPNKTGDLEFKKASSEVVTMALYTFVYYYVSGKVVDVFHVRNKKEEIQIYSNNASLPTILIHAFPHTCTIIDGKGAYSGAPIKIIHMVLSNAEVKNAISLIKEVDPNAFVTVYDVHQVYGAFYIKPVK